MNSPLVRAVLIALALAVVVGVVFSVIDAIDDYAGPAAILTFILVLLAHFVGDGRGRTRV